MNLNMSWHHPALYVADCNLGKGVFAKGALKAGVVIARMGGHIMTLEEEAALPPPLNDYPHQIDDIFVIGPRSVAEVGLTDYFNHSCEPNIGFLGQIFFVTIKPVKPKDELTFDYAMAVSGKPYSIHCDCGRKHCRGVITADDWKIPALQVSYAGYFQPYIANKIAMLAPPRKATP